MSKKSTRALASATLMSLVLTTALSAGPVKAAAGQATRIGEADRYSTAASVATKNWDKAETVVLVNGEGYADAVSGSALAKKLNAPILLTAGNALTTETKAALTKLGAKKVYVVGGNASVSAALRTELKASYEVKELGGANRYETNAAVAEELVALGVDPANVMMVGGEGFSDALSVAPVAAAKGQILLLGMNDANYMKPVVDFVKKHNSKVTVVGTKGVINDAIYEAVGATSRVEGGADRWDTNQKVLAAFKDTVKFDKLYVASASYNAKDNGFADALVASALAGKYAAPLVLVDKDGATGTNNALAYIKANASKTTDLNVVGGTGVVSDSVLKAITDAVNPSTPGQNGDNTVADIKTVGLNQFEVVFNSNVDEDTAELARYYKIGGTQLDDENAHIELINDNTVRITLVKSKFSINQGDEKTVTVKKGILTADKTQTIEKSDIRVTFKDLEAPTLKNVSVKGNNKLVIEFSEAVNMKDIDKVADLVQINGKNLPSYTKSSDSYPGLSEIKEGTKADTDGNVWANKVQFYFSSKLSSGENTIKVKDAKNNVLIDGAGFAFKQAEETVTVDEVSTKPEIKDIKATDNGKVYIKFDRAMDSKTVSNLSNYLINDTKLPDGATAELDSDDDTDSTIKLKHLGNILKDDTNVLELQDGLKDAYGNKVEDELRKSFDKEKDETKPTVVNAIIIDNKTLRVQFSEDVKYSYAVNVSNYELKDASDVDVLHTDRDKISIVASNATSDDDYEDTDTYDIKFDGTKTKLDSSKYTLTVKNIVDIANEPNQMDDQTIEVDGDTDESPSLDDIEAFVKSAGEDKDSTEVAIYFGKEMDPSSLNDHSNYFYIDGDGDSEELPEDVDITVSADNKSVVLDFDDANKTINPGAKSGDEYVKKIGVKTAKDANGNEIYVGAIEIKGSSDTKPSFETDTFKLYKEDGDDDLKADIQLDIPLDSEYASDFVITSKKDSSIKIAADSIDTNSKKVTLTFNEGYKANMVTALGMDAMLTTVDSPKSEDIAGRTLAAKQSQEVYYYGVAPETDRDNYTANIIVNDAGVKTGAEINVTLKTKVDEDRLQSYRDDFKFTAGGTNLDITNVRVASTTVKEDGEDVVRPTLVFTVDSSDVQFVKKDATMGISVSSDDSDIDLRSPRDKDGNYVKFVATSDDYKVKNVTIGETKTVAVDKSALKTEITNAGKLTSTDYTTATWDAMQTKLTIAKGVDANDSATQAEVNSAKDALITAVGALQYTDAKKVADAKAAVINGSVTVATGANDAAKLAAVQTYVNGLVKNGVTAVVTANETTPGDYDVKLTSGSVNDTITITMTITEA